MVYKIALAICVIPILIGMAWVSATSSTSAEFALSLLAIAAFGLRLADGSSMGFAFILLALPRLGWMETVLMACSAILIHTVVRRDRPEAKRLLQSLLGAAVAIMASEAVFRAPNFAWFGPSARLMLASGLCFVAMRAFHRKRSEFWVFPFYPLAASFAAAVPVTAWSSAVVYGAWRLYRLYERKLEHQREHSRRADSLHLRTIETLAAAIESKDKLSAGRLRRVQIYAVEMGKELKLPAQELEALRAASMLYDIGEMAVPEHIMQKPGPLTPDEYEKVKIHPTVGAQMLERVNFPYPVTPIVWSHHERWDGTGYPRGLKGEEIPLGARILAAADALHSLTSARPHRAALSLGEALELVAEGSGKAYDPKVITLLRKRHAEWEKLVTAEPSDKFVDSILSAQREAQVVFDLVQKLGTSLDLKETFAEVTPALRNLMRFDTMILWVERDGFLVSEYVDGAHVALCSSLKMPVGGGVSGWVASKGKPINNGDAPFELGQAGIQPYLCPFDYALSVPLEGGGVRGALTVYRILQRQFTAEEARMLSALAPNLSVALANGLKFRDASQQAATDALTGLPNAGALFRRLDRGAPAALLVCDLDGFKKVNDTLGHLTGNRLLQALADGFRKSCRGHDFVARMGGDEFVLLMEKITPEEIGPRMEQFRDMVRSVGRQVCGDDVLDASFGAAFHPADGKTPDELLAFADQQMYRRKNERKSGVLRMEQRKASA